MKEILEKSLLKKIERLEAFEERMGVRFENISVTVKEWSDEDYFEIYVEIHPIKGNNLTESVTIDCVLYDFENKIIEKSYTYLFKDKFFGFEIEMFNYREQNLINRIKKIRIYPKK